MMRHIVIGDVHGCINEFTALLNKLALTEHDKVYSVGDLMDKGPDPIGCIKLARKLNMTVVLGNHENKPQRWLRHEANSAKTGKKNPMTSVSDIEKKVYSSLDKEEQDWLMNLPVIHVIDSLNTVIVHGGFLPGLPIDVQARKRIGEVIRLRFVDADTGSFVSLMNGPEQPPNTLLWSEVYDGPYNVVYGHISHSLENPRIDKRSDGIECVGIDTGCVTGGRLTAYILESKEFVQVQAEKQYADFWKAD